MQRKQRRSKEADIEALRRQLAAARAEIRRLRAAVETDALVGLANRRGFETALARCLAYGARYGARAALLFLDVNGLKQINDRHGHAAGDRVLQQVARLLQRQIRRSDFCGRLGGDEFAVVFWNIDAAGLRAKADEFNAALAARPLRVGRAPVAASLAAGGTLLRKSDTVKGAIARADRAMYRNKARGRRAV